MGGLIHIWYEAIVDGSRAVNSMWDSVKCGLNVMKKLVAQ